MKEIFSGVYMKGKKIYTKSMINGKSAVYGEQIVKDGGSEYREWIPERSKLGAAIAKKMKPGISEGDKVLYLGASTGTTVSHVSDIAGAAGIVYAVEFAERVARKLIPLAESRGNIAPIFADARKPEEYGWVEQCDVLFCDIAQPDETEIAIRNSTYLKKGGLLMVAVKSQSIDVTKRPEDVYKEEKEKIKKAGFRIIDLIDLEPYEKAHAMIVAEKA